MIVMKRNGINPRYQACEDLRSEGAFFRFSFRAKSNANVPQRHIALRACFITSISMSLKGLQATKLRYKPSILEREKAITQVMKQFLMIFQTKPK